MERAIPDLLPGTLELLILKTLVRGPLRRSSETLHGYAIAHRLRDLSDDVLQVGETSLYPALQRLLLKGCSPFRKSPTLPEAKCKACCERRPYLALRGSDEATILPAIHRAITDVDPSLLMAGSSRSAA